MTQPARPGVPAERPLTDPGPPDPVATDTLADPAPEVLDPPQPETEPDLPEPTEEDTAVPVDTQVILQGEGTGCTAFGYLREITEQGVVVHLMVTSDGPEPLGLSAVTVSLLLQDEVSEPARLPELTLAMGEGWEADLTFGMQRTELAPGEATLELRLGDAEPVYATI